MSDCIDLGKKAMTLETAPAFAPYTGVLLWYDDENAFRSGDETGRVLEAECPWATQQMADDMLSAVAGYAYRPFTATGAILDPAAELGDAVYVGGVCSVLASIDTTFDAMCAADIGAPADEEIDHECPYTSPMERKLGRKVSLGKTYHGTTIDRKHGIRIVRTAADGTEQNRALLNSDTLAFYDAEGNPAIYFDAAAGRYRFYGDVNVTGGSININDQFLVDEQGNVVMSGTISWGNSSPYQSQFSEDGETGWHDKMTPDDLYRRDSYDGGKMWGEAYQFRGEDGSDADVPSYIKSTYISKTEIRSPIITGNDIRALGAFQVGYGSADDFTGTGFMGYAEGLDALGNVTEGVALSNGETLEEGDNYVIVTNGGVRLQAGTTKIYATGNSAHIVVGSTDFKVLSDGVYINGTKIG
ncbi:MAG: hypothetical protein IJE22_01670 [Oscillibacter sp.]|nr:hypothetical protein [Oscillibacter sp.]